MTWTFRPKHYPHFDAPLSARRAEALVRDVNQVARNKFYPFIRYEDKWQPFRAKAKKPSPKIRPIRYASRRDSYIFSYYRYLLSELYEQRIAGTGISNSVIAYRKIPSAFGGGKSNINFAKEAFDVIKACGTCGVAALDISQFFESLDHARLERHWCFLLAVPDLPPDHRAVFRAITRYAEVDRDAVYERLGYSRWEPIGSGNHLVYTVPYELMPKQLCSPQEFRDVILGGNGAAKSLVRTNRKPYGIPQGSPISDILANIYMMSFDEEMIEFVERQGGKYFRYSDDILVIVPGGAVEANAAKQFAMDAISRSGVNLFIKESKCSVLEYFPSEDGQDFHCVSGKGRQGLEYLGFRYDGRQSFIRDATLSRLYRKITLSARAAAAAHKRRYVGKSILDQIALFDFGSFMERYGKVEDFDHDSDHREWTFRTYANRAASVFSEQGPPILRQLRNYKKYVRRRVEAELRGP